jgi:hypothetical protein
LSCIRCATSKQCIQRRHHIEHYLANHLSPALLEPVTGGVSDPSA